MLVNTQRMGDEIIVSSWISTNLLTLNSETVSGTVSEGLNGWSEALTVGLAV